MAPKQVAKRKRNVDDRSDTSAGLLSLNEPKKRPKRTWGKSLSRLDESADDTGRDGSKDFQHWAQWLDRISHGEVETSKKLTKSFEQNADKQVKQLKSLLQKHEDKLKEGQHKFTTTFKKAYFEATVWPIKPLPSITPSERVNEGLALLQEAQSLITDGGSMIKTYLELNKRLQEYHIELPVANFKKDKQDIKEILACGREHGEMIAKGHLAPQIYKPLDTDKTKISGHQKTAANIFQDSHKTMQSSMGNIVAEQLQGFKRLITTIPPN